MKITTLKLIKLAGIVFLAAMAAALLLSVCMAYESLLASVGWHDTASVGWHGMCSVGWHGNARVGWYDFASVGWVN